MEPQQATKPPVTQQAVKLKAFQEVTVGKVLNQVNEMQAAGAIDLPADYSSANALKAAWFTLLATEDRNKKPVIESCTPESICNTLLEMVTQGLNPMKKQCAFIAYGNTLTLSVEYFGKIALAKRYNPTIEQVTSNVIYEKDIFKYEINPITGRKTVIEHSQVLENINPDKIRGAYATIIFTDGSSAMEPMTMDQVKKAWNQGATNGTSPAHKNFPDQMAMKSVINRILKPYINASDDSELLPINGSEQVPKSANSKVIDIESEVVQPEPEPIKQQDTPKAEPTVSGPDF